jgi:hypothetical protein
MRNVVESLLLRVAVAGAVAAGVSVLTAVPVERSAVIANPLCAPHPVKMPCLQNHAYTG